MRIGVLGAGQLGRMLALSGYPLAKTFVFYDMSGSPSAGLGEVIIDRDGQYLDDFISRVDRVTYEFEHLPVDVAERIAKEKPVHPCLGHCRFARTVRWRKPCLVNSASRRHGGKLLTAQSLCRLRPKNWAAPLSPNPIPRL